MFKLESNRMDKSLTFSLKIRFLYFVFFFFQALQNVKSIKKSWVIMSCYFLHNNYYHCHWCTLMWCPGPEIDPFWYVGRGVRPIGRFGKRHSSMEALGSGGIQPVVRMLALLLDSIRNKENLGNVLDGEDRDWLPWQRVLFPSSINS